MCYQNEEPGKNASGHKSQGPIVWRKAVALASKVYAATRQLPSEERFGLTAQLLRAVVSVPSNIAEGAGRRTRGELIQYLHVARGSLSEVETQILIAIDQGFIAAADAHLEDIAEVGRMLNGLIRTLTASSRAAHAKACAPHQPLATNR